MTASTTTGIHTATCKCEGCDRLISRDGYCRPHFISESLGWNLGDRSLRRIPLGRLSDTQTDALRRATYGETSLANILDVIRGMGVPLPPHRRAVEGTFRCDTGEEVEHGLPQS